MGMTTFGLCAALALGIALAFTQGWGRLHRVSVRALWGFSLLSVPMAFLCSRIAFVLPNVTHYLSTWNNPALMLHFWDGGASLMGAFAGLMLSALLTSKVCRVSFGTLADGVAMGLPWAILIERLAEHTVADFGVGRPIDAEFLQGLGAFTDGCHPVYLYEALFAGIVLNVVLFLLSNPRGKFATRHPGDLMLVFMTLYGAAQVLFESLRDDSHMIVIHFVRINQIGAIVLCAIALTVWTVRWARAGAKKAQVAVAWGIELAAIAMGVVQEFAVDSSLNKLLDYSIMALCLAVVAAVGLTVRRFANRASTANAEERSVTGRG